PGWWSGNRRSSRSPAWLGNTGRWLSADMSGPSWQCPLLVVDPEAGPVLLLFSIQQLADQPSPCASRLAFPPMAAVFMVLVRSVTKRNRSCGPQALGPVPDRPIPPKGCTPTTAPIILRLI